MGGGDAADITARPPTSPPMSNDPPAPVRDAAAADVDPRVARTTRALGQALVELIREGDYRDVTVQQILDRAGVGRATFYAHYRGKEDALQSSYEQLFSALEPMLARPSPVGPRLFPVTEFLHHVADQRALVEGLRRAGRLEEVWTLCAAHAARLIARRLPDWCGTHVAAMPTPLAARMLAGALVESLRWWDDHPQAATPVDVDTAFHGLARGLLRARR